jgi:hypothetical protein
MPDILHYRGNRVLFDARRIVGPDMDGGFWLPVTAGYDTEADMTTIGYQPVPPARWPAETLLMRAEHERRKELRLTLLASAGHRDTCKRLVEAAMRAPQPVKHTEIGKWLNT